MNIQDDGKTAQVGHEELINGSGSKDNENNLPSSDIRKIKLNYIQLNKRATTASTGVGGRKIPQKVATT